MYEGSLSTPRGAAGEALPRASSSRCTWSPAPLGAFDPLRAISFASLCLRERLVCTLNPDATNQKSRSAEIGTTT